MITTSCTIDSSDCENTWPTIALQAVIHWIDRMRRTEMYVFSLSLPPLSHTRTHITLSPYTWVVRFFNEPKRIYAQDNAQESGPKLPSSLRVQCMYIYTFFCLCGCNLSIATYCCARCVACVLDRPVATSRRETDDAIVTGTAFTVVPLRDSDKLGIKLERIHQVRISTVCCNTAAAFPFRKQPHVPHLTPNSPVWLLT